MTTIEKTVEIPADHRLKLELPIPDDIPAGRAEIKVTVIPYPEEPQSSSADESINRLKSLAGVLKDSKTFAGDPVELQRKMRGYYDNE